MRLITPNFLILLLSDNMASHAVKFADSFVDPSGKKLWVEVREDGYFNATRMCSSAGKSWGAYYRNDKNKANLKVCMRRLAKPESEVIEINKTNNIGDRSTWVHRCDH